MRRKGIAMRCKAEEEFGSTEPGNAREERRRVWQRQCDAKRCNGAAMFRTVRYGNGKAERGYVKQWRGPVGNRGAMEMRGAAWSGDVTQCKGMDL